MSKPLKPKKAPSSSELKSYAKWDKGSDVFQFKAIGEVRSCFKERFGIPRQPGLAPSAGGTLELKNDSGMREALKTLETFTHVWVLFVFHEHGAKGWNPSVRPPRLGGGKRVGVLASRSPHRPNPIGISVFKILGVRYDKGPKIDVEGVDLLDGTPILDIKPYIPYCDSVVDAGCGWASNPVVEKMRLEYSEVAHEQISKISLKIPSFPALVEELMSLDPRPAFQKKDAMGGTYGFRILDWDVRFKAFPDYLAIQEVVAWSPKKKKTPSAVS